MWTFDLAGTSAIQRLTFGGNNRFPIWSADSTRVTFQSDREGDLGIFWQLADGTGTVERLTKPNAGRIARAGVVVAACRIGSCCSTSGKAPTSRCGCFRCRTGRSRRLAASTRRTSPTGAVFSPDGRWVAYTSTEGTKTTVYVQPFPADRREVRAPGARRRRSARGHVVGRRQGALLQSAARRLRGRERRRRSRRSRSAIPVAVPRTFTLGPPGARRAYDVTPAGKFVGVTAAGAAATDRADRAPENSRRAQLV